MRAEGSGDCNVIVYLVKQPHIYDVYRVKVSSVVKPYSPVYLHVGGFVTFKLMDQNSADYSAKKDSSTVWSSNNPSALDINQATGEARGLSEGRAEILLSNHISAASIAQVSRVKHAELDDQSRKMLVINTDEYQQEPLRVRFKLYLHEQVEELTPTVQFDGITLIKQNVGILCETNPPGLVEAKSEINDLEGFFCVLKYRGGSSTRAIPRSTKIHLTVYGPNPAKPDDISAALYRDRILSFEVPFISKIQVESFYRNGISLNKQHRSASVKIFSNTHFNVHAENVQDSDRGYDLVRFRVNKTDEESTEYFLHVTVPREITHDFSTNIVVIHPTTGLRTVIPVYFQGREGDTNQQQYSEQESIMSGISKMFNSQPQDSSSTTTRTEKIEQPSFFYNYMVIPLLILLFFIFILQTAGMDPIQFLFNILRLRNPFGQQRREQPRRGGAYNPNSSAERSMLQGVA